MVSVVIPLYNKVAYVERTLMSVLAQTYQDYEVVVVDDGSTDGSADVALAIKDDRIRLVRQQNAGVSAARNRGIEEAKGEYIGFLDADDEWKPTYLETQIQLTEKYPQCDVFATNYEFRDEHGITKPTILRKLPFNGEDGELTNYFEVASCSHPPLWTSAVIVHKSAIRSVGGFPVGIKSGEDLLTWARLAVKYRIAFCRKVLAVFISTPSGDDEITKAQQRSGNEEQVLQALLQLYHSCPTNVPKLHIKKYVIRWFKIYAVTLIETERNHKVISIAIRAIKFGGPVKIFVPLMCFGCFPSQIAKKIFKLLRK